MLSSPVCTVLLASMLVAAADDTRTANANPAARQRESLSVMPVRVRAAGLDDPRTVALLTNALTLQLERSSGLDVVATEEVSALLQNEASRQQLGCDTQACLAELAGALGSRFLAVGEVLALENELLWSCTLLDQREGVVVGRASVQRGSVAALAEAAQELALALSGTNPLLEDEDVAQRRLGFSSTRDVRAFRRFRQTRPAASLSNALTAYITKRNTESLRMSAAQAAFLLLASLGGGGVLALLVGSFPMPLPLRFSMVVGSVVPLTLGSGALLVACVLLGIDALDLGRLSVQASGCCRNEEDLADAEANTRWLQAVGGIMVLVGPMGAALGAMVGAASVAGVVVLLTAERVNSERDRWSGPFAVEAPTLCTATCCLGLAGILLALTTAVSATAGTIQVLRPQPRMVDGKPPRAKARHGAGVSP